MMHVVHIVDHIHHYLNESKKLNLLRIGNGGCVDLIIGTLGDRPDEFNSVYRNIA